jgi:hypothetical protein
MVPAGGGNGGDGKGKIFVGLAVLAVVAVAAFVVIGGGDDGGSGGGSPTGTVEALFAAAKNGDCEKAVGLVTEASWSEGGSVSKEQALADCKAGSSDAGAALERAAGATISNVKELSKTDTTASVSATMEMGGEPVDLVFPLVKENGAWRVEMGGISEAMSDGTGVDAPDLPGGLDPSDLADIPECDYQSEDFDAEACAEASGVILGG